jgi:hypothetical protein
MEADDVERALDHAVEEGEHHSGQPRRAGSGWSSW